MGARFATTGGKVTTTTGLKTAVGVTGGTGLRIRLYDFTVSAVGTPADNVLRWVVQRSTAAGTLTAITPAPLDSADAAAEATAGENHTVEPTYTTATELFDNAVNQRATYRWVAAPGGELIVPATASNGIGFQVLSPAYTGQSDATLHHEE